MPIDPTLNRLLTALEVAPHAFSVCRIQSGWRMSFPVFKAVTVHFVLRGSGHVQIRAASRQRRHDDAVLELQIADRDGLQDRTGRCIGQGVILNRRTRPQGEE